MKNEERILIKIRKEEAKKLNTLGVPYGENGISHTHGHHMHYYLCESKKNIGLLEKMRRESMK